MYARKPDGNFDKSKTWHEFRSAELRSEVSERAYNLYCNSDYSIVEREKTDDNDETVKVYAVLEGQTYFSDCLIDCTLKEAGEFFADMAKELDEENEIEIMGNFDLDKLKQDIDDLNKSAEKSWQNERIIKLEEPVHTDGKIKFCFEMGKFMDEKAFFDVTLDLVGNYDIKAAPTNSKVQTELFNAFLENIFNKCIN